jgi:hypothetical protein
MQLRESLRRWRPYSGKSPNCRLSPDYKVTHGADMRRIIPFALLLTACSQQPAEQSITTGAFAGNDKRDRICIAGRPGNYRGGVIVFGKGDTNCSASGSIEVKQGDVALIPRGEGDCRIPLTIDGEAIRIGQVPAACSYYCGPGAQLGGKAFPLANQAQTRDGSPATIVDFGGDPLC